MSLIYRTVSDTRPIPFNVTPAATATPTVTLYLDQAETQPRPGAAPTVTGAGTSWSYNLTPAALPAGTYYARISAPTAGGTAVAHDTLLISAAVISSNTDQVTLDQARAHLNFDEQDHKDDSELGFMLRAASDWIATRVGDLTPYPVQLAVLELTRHLWDSQRGSGGGTGFTGNDLDDPTGGLGLLGFAIPNRVRELIEPYLLTTTGKPTGSFPFVRRHPEPAERTFGVGFGDHLGGLEGIYRGVGDYVERW